MKPLILLNFKTYKEVSGDKALVLAKKISQVSKPDYTVAIAPPLLSLKQIAQKVKIPVYSQHVDYKDYGANTGRILPAEVKALGCMGVIINHSEHRLPIAVIEKTVIACKKKKLKTVVCAQSLGVIKKVAQFKSDYIAYEPPALIGGAISITEAQPGIIVKAVDLVKKLSPRTKLLVGAGVKKAEDVGQALALGAKGVLIGSAAAKAKDPKKFLKELLI
ncbi:triose-phosphate isomerase [Candidatus Woesearchaeota archaeon]|jgi:triosephosphate isomerase (TIM)|nr:triose-phosphate isomerase [Candidatus Woesearchaeota archaeon]